MGDLVYGNRCRRSGAGHRRSVIGWVGLAWLAPFLGAFAYLCLGINRIERKAVALKLHEGRARQQKPVLSPDDHKQRADFERDYPNLVGLATAGRILTGWPVIPGNRVEPLVDGDQAYPAMLAAIAGSERSVSLLSYIFDSDLAGVAFLKELVEAQTRGVQVRVLVDDVGSKYTKKFAYSPQTSCDRLHVDRIGDDEAVRVMGEFHDEGVTGDFDLPEVIPVAALDGGVAIASPGLSFVRRGHPGADFRAPSHFNDVTIRHFPPHRTCKHVVAMAS
jgi:hypothetical protein